MNPYLDINRLEFILTERCTGRCKHCSAGEMVAHPKGTCVPEEAAVRAVRELADMFDMPVKTVHNTEGPALGAAILAGVAAGVYEDVPSACEKVVVANAPQVPEADASAAYEPFYQLYTQLYPALKDSYAALAKM